MGGGLPDPGLLGALLCGLPGGTGFSSSRFIKVLGMVKKLAKISIGSGTSWTTWLGPAQGSRTGLSGPSSTSPSSATPWERWSPLSLVLVVGVLPPELHGAPSRGNAGRYTKSSSHRYLPDQPTGPRKLQRVIISFL